MESFGSSIEFIEPQSMNFEIKLNTAYLAFLEQTKFPTEKPNSKITYSTKPPGVLLFNEKGQILETLDE